MAMKHTQNMKDLGTFGQPDALLSALLHQEIQIQMQKGRRQELNSAQDLTNGIFLGPQIILQRVKGVCKTT